MESLQDSWIWIIPALSKDDVTRIPSSTLLSASQAENFPWRRIVSKKLAADGSTITLRI